MHNKQMRRLVRFVEELKRNRFPNTESFARRLTELDLSENLPLATSSKTVQRDIRFLKDELHAPIDYSPEDKGYYLTDPDWQLPSLSLSKDELFAALFCSHIGERFLPSASMRQELEEVKNLQLAAGEPGRLDLGVMESLVVATGASLPLDHALTPLILQAWKEARSLVITYNRGYDNEVVDRTIDIHALFLTAGAWYARAYCHLREEMRSFALHRIKNATLLPATFARSAAVVAEVKRGEVFDYGFVRDIRLEVKPHRALYFKERTWFPGQQIQENADGSLTVQYPAIPEPAFFPWVFSFMGSVTVLAPASARETLRACTASMAQAHGGG